MRTFLDVFKGWLSLLVLAGVLTGCGGGSGTAPSTISGTAATGAPIVGGNVTVTCAGGNALTTTTANDGAWSVTLSGQTLPCAIQVNGGTVNGAANLTPYHSIALALGIANITPLSDLIVANLAGNNDPAAWFAGLNAAAIQGIDAAALNLALGNVRTALNLAALNGINPLTMAFQAAGGDPLDDILEALRAALTTAGTNYAALLNAAAQQGFTPPAGLADAFAAAHAQLLNTNAGGGGTTTTCDNGATNMTYEAHAAGPYNDGDQVCFTASVTTLAFSGKTLSNPVQNMIVSAPYSAYTFADAATGNKYEVVFNNNDLYEINVMNSSDTFLGQFTQTSANAGGGGNGGASTSIGLHGAGFTVPITLAGVIGTYDVVIYRAPAGEEALIGPAKLTISETGGVKAMELTTPGGTVISHIDTSYPYLDPATSFQLNGGIGQITGVNGTAVSNYLVVKFTAAGEITGTAGGFSQIAFRNNMTAHGGTAPAAFTALAGTWSGPALALICGQPNVSVTITTAGKVTLNGTPNLSCATGTVVETTWDGNDDYIIPLSTGGYQIALDSARGGGSNIGGGIFITVSDPTNPTAIVNVKTTLNGLAGNIEVNNPTKQ